MQVEGSENIANAYNTELTESRPIDNNIFILQISVPNSIYLALYEMSEVLEIIKKKVPRP